MCVLSSTRPSVVHLGTSIFSFLHSLLTHSFIAHSFIASFMHLFQDSLVRLFTQQFMGFPGGSDCKESACNAGDLGSIPGSGRSFEEGIGYPLQYSCLGNSLDRGAWRATSPWSHKESDKTVHLSTNVPGLQFAKLGASLLAAVLKVNTLTG